MVTWINKAQLSGKKKRRRTMHSHANLCCPSPDVQLLLVKDVVVLELGDHAPTTYVRRVRLTLKAFTSTFIIFLFTRRIHISFDVLILG
jgi:hypothetical protein